MVLHANPTLHSQDTIQRRICFLLALSFIFLNLFDDHVSSVTNLPSIYIEILLVVACCCICGFILLNARAEVLEILTIFAVATTALLGAALYHPFWGVLGALFLYKLPLAVFSSRLIFAYQSHFDFSLKLLLWLSMISALFAFAEAIWGVRPLSDLAGFSGLEGRAQGIFSNANKNARLCLVGIAVASITLPPRWRWPTILVLGIAIILSASIQGIVAACLYLVTLLALLPRINIWRKFSIALFCIISVAALLLVFGQGYVERFADVQRIFQAGDYFRIKAMFISAQVFGENPFFGLGSGAFGGAVAHASNSHWHDAYHVFDHWIDYTSRPTTIDMFWPHFVAETGIFGVAVMATIMFTLFRRLWRRRTELSVIHWLALMPPFLFFPLLSFSWESPFVALIVGAAWGKIYYESGPAAANA